MLQEFSHCCNFVILQKLPVDLATAQDSLLVELVSVYSKLRQIPKLYNTVVTVIHKHPDVMQVEWPAGFTRRYTCIPSDIGYS